MKNETIVFDKPCNATLMAEDLNESTIGADEYIVKTKYSLISAGTELALYKGKEAPLPLTPGYASVGEITQIGNKVDQFSVGDIVFSYSKHKEYNILNQHRDAVMLKLNPDSDLKQLTYTRIAAVSITALRVCPPELGDWIVINGMGVVGNLAAQLFGLSGANVIAVDINEQRLELAHQCGIKHVVNPAKTNIKEYVNSLTGNRGASTVVEATGVPQLVKEACDLCQSQGTVVLLGSPRGECQDNITDLLNCVHLWKNGCISIKGAHEWRYPIRHNPWNKHSLERNCQIIIKLIEDGKLVIDPLISHTIKPSEAQTAYQGLLNSPEEFVGVVYDWD